LSPEATAFSEDDDVRSERRIRRFVLASRPEVPIHLRKLGTTPTLAKGDGSQAEVGS
jgi:hypothetical protein